MHARKQKLASLGKSMIALSIVDLKPHETLVSARSSIFDPRNFLLGLELFEWSYSNILIFECYEWTSDITVPRLRLFESFVGTLMTRIGVQFLNFSIELVLYFVQCRYIVFQVYTNDLHYCRYVNSFIVMFLTQYRVFECPSILYSSNTVAFSL